MNRYPVVGLVLALCTLCAVSKAAAGQAAAIEPLPQKTQRRADGFSRSRGWQLDVYTGGTFGQTWGRGEGELPPGGEPVVFALIRPTITRLVPSWFFGPGIGLTEEVNASGWLSREGLLPITDVLTKASIRPGDGWTVGARVRRPLRDRLSFEVDVNVSSAGLAFTPAAMARLERSRSRFESFWGSVEERIGQTERTSQAVLMDAHQSSKELRATAGLRFTVMELRQQSFYVSAAPGLASTIGADPSVVLVGRYRLQTLGGPGLPLRFQDETDTVSIHAHAPRVRLTGVMAAGWKRTIFRSIGVEVEGRVTISPSVISTTLDAVPTRVLLDEPLSLGSGVSALLGPEMPTGQSWGLVFNNNAEYSALFPSSLSGPPVRGFQTFATSGVQTTLGVTARVHYRFDW